MLIDQKGVYMEKKLTFLYRLAISTDGYGNTKVVAMFVDDDGNRYLWVTLKTSKTLEKLHSGESYDMIFSVVEILPSNDAKIERVRIKK